MNADAELSKRNLYALLSRVHLNPVLNYLILNSTNSFQHLFFDLAVDSVRMFSSCLFNRYYHPSIHMPLFRIIFRRYIKTKQKQKFQATKVQFPF